MLKKTIILAEDSQDDALLMREVFNEFDLSCGFVWVKDGFELMKFLKENCLNNTKSKLNQYIILLDLNMPHKGGIQCLREIRSSENDIIKNVPIIVFTGSQSEEDLRACRMLGANCFIPKPSNQEEVNEMFSGIKNLS